MADDLPSERIEDGETLGRSVFRSTAAKRAKRDGTIIRDVFLVRREDDSVSVDRMDYEAAETMAALADARGRERGDTFYGWASLSASEARADDAEFARVVRATPLPDNPCHADIVMLISAELSDEERRDVQKQHAVALAAVAEWRPRPSGDTGI